MSAKRTTRQEYIANCIDNILAAPCDYKHRRQRTLDLAEAVYVRAKEGERAAHEYLIQLSKDAEGGKYQEE